MSQTFDEISRQLGRRHRRSARLKWVSMAALGMAGLFLLWFFSDMLNKGLPAFQQAYVKTTVSYNEQAARDGRQAIAPGLVPLVSRTEVRGIPRLLRNNPDMIGTRDTGWLLATSEVDQYLKGHRNTLSEEEQAEIEDRVAKGQIALRFNTTFFIQGDSRIAESAGILSAIVGTIMTMIVTLAIAFPIGVMTAIYLEEFAPDNRFTQLIEININNLAAIPSILFGLLGLAIFINFFGVPRSSPLAGGMTLALMTLPVIIISTRTALRSVPDSIRHAAFGVG
ncbi:MAG: DUF3333 domain-containing protein, partial [Halomonadaceae bacterium]